MLPVVALAQYVTPGGGGGTSDSIGVDADGNSVFEAYLYPAFLQKGPNITFTVDNDTLTLSGPAAAGTADSMGVDTDGNGTIDGYLYSTVAGAFHIKKGANITLTIDTDKLTIAGPAASGTDRPAEPPPPQPPPRTTLAPAKPIPFNTSRRFQRSS